MLFEELTSYHLSATGLGGLRNPPRPVSVEYHYLMALTIAKIRYNNAIKAYTIACIILLLLKVRVVIARLDWRGATCQSSFLYKLWSFQQFPQSVRVSAFGVRQIDNLLGDFYV